MDAKNLIFPDIQRIEDYGLQGVSSIFLKKVDLGDRISYIGQGAFLGNDQLKTLIVRNNNEVPYISDDAFSGSAFVDSGDAYIYVPKTMTDGSDGVNEYKSVRSKIIQILHQKQKTRKELISIHIVWSLIIYVFCAALL